MHPAWYRIGGLAHDLPQGWDRLVREFVDYLPARLDEYQKVALENSIVVSRTRGIAAYDTAQAMEWGTTGGGLRATGLGYDLRKERPYCGDENFDFAVPTGTRGDAYDRMIRTEKRRGGKECVSRVRFWWLP